MGTRGGITGSPQQRDPFAVDQDRALRVLRATPAKIRSFFADPKLAYIRRAYA